MARTGARTGARMGTTGGGEASGEARERARRRRKAAILWGAFGIAAGAGAVLGRGDALLDPAQRLSPAVAATLTAAFLVLAIAASVALMRQTDEFELADRRRAITAAAGAYVLGYPSWFLLWKGGFLPEPMHGLLFGGFCAVLLAATVILRLR